ncbi:MAG: hypothetical protein K2P94_07720 [Rhodospirillaceae bacterium]|nr:hypothetical protein [Rhodospirillaceae bacterium]
MRFLLRTMICVGAFASTPALALHCYTLALKDDKGAVVSVSPPAIGLMIGVNPVIEGAYPPHVTREPVAPAQCPESLVESIRATFNASCLGDDLRKKAADANKVPVEMVSKGCGEMEAALQNKDVEFYRERDKTLFPQKPDIFPKKPGPK